VNRIQSRVFFGRSRQGLSTSTPRLIRMSRRFWPPQAIGQAATARSVADARAAAGPFDAALVDLHLGDDEPDGLAAVDFLRARGVRRIALVTADTRDGLKEQAAAAGAILLPKPVKPAALKAFLRS